MDHPTISKELIDHLTRLFPPLPPDEFETLEELRVRAGEQKVIRLLHRLYEQQNENPLQNGTRF